MESWQQVITLERTLCLKLSDKSKSKTVHLIGMDQLAINRTKTCLLQQNKFRLIRKKSKFKVIGSSLIQPI
jgi:hypothetical protein